MTETEARVRSMDKFRRHLYLEAAGWTLRHVYRKDRWVDAWLHPTHEQPGGDTRHYTPAAAIRAAVAAELDADQASQ